MKYADLHLHSIYSDSTYTPEQLIKQAKSAGLSAIALVDHDTVEGIQPTLDAAAGEGIEVIPGIELTTEYDGAEIHMLGYLIDYQSKALLERLANLKNIRIDRIHKIVDKLKGIGVELSADKVFEIANGGTVGRLHVARAMLQNGLVSTIAEAFQKYIGDKCPAYILGFRLSPDEAIKLIKAAGGVPILAHPYALGRNDLIPVFVEQGLMGLEVYYPEHSQSMTNTYLEIAKKYNLLVTGGSDCHGSAKPEIRIGAVKLPYDLVERLKNSRNI